MPCQEYRGQDEEPAMSNNNDEQLDALLGVPREAKALELKDWIDPTTGAGTAKIAKACIALRNNDGGRLIVGIKDDGTRNANCPFADVRTRFDVETIQAIVSKFASHPFEIHVQFVEREGVEFPVITVEGGIRKPVVTRSEIPNEIQNNTVYVRTLNSSGIVSSAPATHKDWDDLIERCFRNREADIGDFLRRHLLDGLDADRISSLREGLKGVCSTMQEGDSSVTAFSMEKSLLESSSKDANERRTKECLDKGAERFQELVEERGVDLTSQGTFEVALIIHGEFDELKLTDQDIRSILRQNPNLTGWPLWLDSFGFPDEKSRPFPTRDAWEALIVGEGVFFGRYEEYWRITSQGCFYHRRGLRDDLWNRPGAEAGRTFEFDFPMIDVADAIAQGRAYAQDLTEDLEACHLNLMIRWKGLKNRELRSWAERGRYLHPGRRSHENSFTQFVSVRAAASDQEIVETTANVTRPLLRLFDGFELGDGIVREIVKPLLERRLR